MNFIPNHNFDVIRVAHSINNKKAVTIHLSNEIAAMIDQKRKEWGLRSRGEVIEHLLGWMVEPSSEQK